MFRTLFLWAVFFAVLAPATAQTDLVFPWISNNSLFRTQIIVNNTGSTAASVSFNALRSGGESETQTRDIAPFGQLVINAGDLFPGLGEGSGYRIRLTSDNSDISAGFVVSGTASASGSSPAQANVPQATTAAPILLFNYLPIPTDGGSSAPVVVNMGDSAADVTFYAYQGGQQVATAVQQAIPAGEPFAQVTGTLFPDITGDIYLVAESSNPLIGTAFIFNASREPSMADAVAIAAVPTPVTQEPISFAERIQPIIDQSCGSGACHLNGQAQAGLNLDPANAYNNIVNVPSSVVPDAIRVLPGDANNSYLFRKLHDRSEFGYVGERMPRGRAPLDQDQLDLIRDWINGGAER